MKKILFILVLVVFASSCLVIEERYTEPGVRMTPDREYTTSYYDVYPGAYTSPFYYYDPMFSFGMGWWSPLWYYGMYRTYWGYSGGYYGGYSGGYYGYRPYYGSRVYGRAPSRTRVSRDALGRSGSTSRVSRGTVSRTRVTRSGSSGRISRSSGTRSSGSRSSGRTSSGSRVRRKN